MTKAKKARGSDWMKASGYWADETVPDLTSLLVCRGINPAEFAEWLGPQLGKFRGMQSIEAASPTPVEEADVLADVRRHAQTLSATLLTGLPPLAHAHLKRLARERDVKWSDMVARVTEDLARIAALAQLFEAQARAVEVPRGRKPSTSRDALVTAVVNRLKKVKRAGKAVPLTTADVHELAREILQKCRVPMPDELKRATRRGT